MSGGDSVRITINGREAEAAAGARLLDALDAHGVHVPRLCHDPRLAPTNVCRICEVDVEGRPRSVCACSTPVEAGMRVLTHTPQLEEFRKTLLEMMARTYPAEAVARLDLPFHRYLRQYGVSPPEKPPADRLVDDTHPYIRVDMRRCIDCFRCARICDSVQGQFSWMVVNKGSATRVLPDSGTTLLESSCVSCGACVDSCPTGALDDASLIELGLPASWTRTTCPYCGTGCELNAGVKDDKLVVVRPVLDAPVSKGHLCAKGRYATGYIDASDRVLRPMVRRAGAWAAVSWAEAVAEAAAALRGVKERHGPDALGVLGSSRATNEESFLAQKLARVVLGTNNVDCCARVCHAPSAAGLGALFGTGAATNSFDDIERAGAFLIFGCNPTENHPVVGARIKQRVLAGVPLILADPRRTELAPLAAVHLALRPGTNLPLLQALAHVIVEEGLHDADFVARRTEAFPAYAESLKDWTPERASSLCGVDARLIREAARIYATRKPAMCFHGLGVTEQVQGTDGVVALGQLAMLTGNLGVPGAGVNPLRGQNNVQGTALMGCEPDKLTGSQPLGSARAAHERLWGATLPKTAGKNLMGMIDAAAAGALKGLLIFGYDVLLTNPDADATAAALSRLEAVVVVDPFMTKTAEAFGTVFLPASTSFEKDGTFMNSERRVQRVRKALTPRGESKPDADIIALLAAGLGAPAGFAYPGASAVWDEVRALWPAVRGITYERLEKGGLQWPCPTEDHPGTAVLHETAFKSGPRAAFRVLEYSPSSERTTAGFPFLLNTGRTLHHFNAATMTGRSSAARLQRDDLVLVNERDASRLGIGDGARVVVESAHGRFRGTASVTDAVQPGQLFATFHRAEAMVNRATGRGRDPVTATPEYKVTAVSLRLETDREERR